MRCCGQRLQWLLIGSHLQGEPGIYQAGSAALVTGWFKDVSAKGPTYFQGDTATRIDVVIANSVVSPGIVVTGVMVEVPNSKAQTCVAQAASGDLPCTQ